MTPDSDGSALLDMLEGVRSAGPNSFVARCPAHEDRTPSLSIRFVADRVLLKCFAGCSTESILGELGMTFRHLFNATFDTLPEQASGGARTTHRNPADQLAQCDRLHDAWDRADPLKPGDETHTYLTSRGLGLSSGLPPVLRNATRVGYYAHTGARPTFHPCMLGRVEAASGKLVALHRTYLAEGGVGKAKVECPKKLTKAITPGATRGAAIRLFTATSRLAVAEGIETALAVAESTGWPTWATVSAGGMAALDVPETVDELLIAADHDRAGLDAARALALRFESTGKEALMAVPPTPGFDWLDELTQEEAA